MLEKLPPILKFVFVFLLSLFFQISINFAQNIPPELQKVLRDPNLMRKIMEENQPKGEMTFPALPPQQYFQPPAGLAAKYKPYEKFFQSGVALAYELDKCVESGKEAVYIKNMYVLYLDEEKLDSSFTTNQKARTANIKLKGLVEHWRGKCNSNELQKAGISKGGLDFNFVNAFHIRPRWFSSSSGSGRFFGAGLDEVLKGASQKGEPVAFSYAKSENKSAYDTKILDALRKAGYPIPNVNPAEYEKAAQDYLKANGISLNLDKAAFYGRLESARRISLPGGQSVAAIQVDFGITSGFEADMLVYKPKAMASNGTSSAPQTIAERAVLKDVFFQKVSYENHFSDILEKFTNQTQTEAVGGVLIPDGLQNSLGAQAFVNLDNDDGDEKFDKDDTDVTNGDDDLVKVVLRAKITQTLSAKAKFEVLSGGDNVKVYFSADKKLEFTREQMKMPLTVTNNFLGREKDFRTKTLWIEGTDADTTQKATVFKFSYWEMGDVRQPPSVEETFTMTVIGIEKIDWEGNGNSIKNDNLLDIDVNHRNPSDTYTNSEPSRNGRPFPTECGGSVQSTLAPEAVRVFPGSRLVGEKVSASRDKVKAKIRLSVEPVEPFIFYFKSFDVDDPSFSDQSKLLPQSMRQPPADATLKNVDNEEKAEDNRGKTKANNSNKGFFKDEDADGIVRKEFSKQDDELEFTVTMQPGDNFRIVGSGDKKFLKNLENDDKKLNLGSTDEIKNRNKQKIVDKSIFNKNPLNPTDAEIRYPEKYASKVLTVWRFFYAEIDYMDTITDNKIKGAIGKIENDTPRIGLTKINLKVNLTKEYQKIATHVSTLNHNGVENAFQQGTMRVGGIEYPVLYNSAHTGGILLSPNDYVVVRGDVPSNLPDDSTFFLWDDDEEWKNIKIGTRMRDLEIKGKVLASGGTFLDRIPLEKSKACFVSERFLPAYVVPDFKTLIPVNKEDTVPFVRNVRAEKIGMKLDKYYTEEHYKFDFANYDRSEDFWTIYMLFGYKGATYEDGDPDGVDGVNPIRDANGANMKGEGAIEGFTDLNFTGIMFFLEGIIERNQGYMVYNGMTGEEDCVAHEIGHIFGAKHDDSGLMGADGEQNSYVFTGTTLERIRSAKHP